MIVAINELNIFDIKNNKERTPTLSDQNKLIELGVEMDYKGRWYVVPEDIILAW